MLSDEDKALDAMQEVFVQLIRKQDRLKDEYPSSLLFRIATNTCLNIIRYHKRRPESPNETVLETLAAFDETEEKVAARDFLDKIFGREKQSTRLIAVLHLVDGLTLKEVAGEVGLSVSGVRKRLRLLKERVRGMSGEVWEWK